MIKHRSSRVTGLSEEVYSFSGICEQIYSEREVRGESYQDFVISGLKFVVRGGVLGFEVGDRVKVRFRIEGRTYRGIMLVNLIFLDFDFL